ncbi:MAG TPA: CHAT domain-containing protein [Thermoanaerobaculia bacterium]|nr:CHAT domain-containing protein [Thermoanaerobaculia bacterium]
MAPADEDPAFASAAALREADRHQEAAAEYERLAAEFERTGDRRRQAVARIELAYRQLLLGQHADAEAALPELRELTAGNVPLASRVAHLGAIVLYREGKMEEALREAERALARARDAGDPELTGQTYGVLGTVHSLSGRYRESLATSERRVALARRHLPGSGELTRALNSLGIDYRHFGRYAEAERVYEEALAIHRAEQDTNGVAIILYNRFGESEAGDPDWRAAAASLYGLLLDPLAPGPGREILVVAERPLGLDPAGPRAGSATGPFGRAMLAVGNPAAAGVGVSAAPLPYAEAEARRVTRLYGRAGSDLLRGEQATLSGCETALGERVRGEGVVGLPHAFLAAGARAVLVSLWRVDDRETAELMHRFYRELDAGHAPGEALWRARRGWLTGPEGPAHPSRWAPFILVGSLGSR